MPDADEATTGRPDEKQPKGGGKMLVSWEILVYRHFDVSALPNDGVDGGLNRLIEFGLRFSEFEPDRS